MSSYAFASLAHIRVLLLPVGPISRDSFEAFATEVRASDAIRLGDIPGDSKGEQARFLPTPLTPGYVHLSFCSHPISPTHAPLSLFRPSHFNLAIIGIAACSDTCPPETALQQFNDIIDQIRPEDWTFPLAKVCFAFQSDAGASRNLGDPPGLVSIPSIMSNRKLYIGTLLADLCSQIIGEFGRVVHALETPVGNEHLNATPFPAFPSSSNLSTMVGRNPLLSSQAPYALYPSTSELVPGLSGAADHALQRSSSVPPVLHPPSSALLRQSTFGPLSKKRVSTVGTASSHARLYKVYGDFYLLAGRTQDAKIWYQEALSLFKTGSDPIWQASVIESLAVLSVLESWASAQGVQASTSDMKEPWMEIHNQLSQAIALYLKSVTPLETAQDYSLVSFIYTMAVLRQTSLLLCVWSSKGWGPLAFTSMLQPGSTSHLKKISANKSSAILERLSATTGITRSHIASTLSQSHGAWLLHLGPHERLVVLQSMASIYNCIGFKRKEVYVLREVISCIMDLVVCGRDEDEQLRMSNVGSAGKAVRTAVLTDTGGPANGGSVGVRWNDNIDGNRSILKLLNYACKVLGVNLESVNLLHTNKGELEGDGPSEDLQLQLEDPELFDSLKVSFGWPELQVGVIREAIAVAEALPDPPAVARIGFSALKTMHKVLTANDQYHLHQTASRALDVLKRRGETATVEWWAGNPAFSISLLPLPSHRLLVEKPMTLLPSSISSAIPVLPIKTDPFLYNPRKSTDALEKNVLVQGEVAELVITLQNPFVFDLELLDVSLITSGVAFKCSASSIVVRANSFYNLSVSGIPTESGTLVIKGCVVQAPNGAPREFFLPVYTEAEEELQARRQSMIKCESGRIKYAGLRSPLWETGEKRFSTLLQPSKLRPRFLECIVVPEQPLLRMRWTSLTHGALMLYNGEKSSIRLTLENVSALPIDFLQLAFEDSTIGPAHEVLSGGSLSALEAYETEFELNHRQVFSWQHEKEAKIIHAGQKITLSVTCLGKVGCTSGAVHVSYSYAHRHGNQNQTNMMFYARQLTSPVTVTVYHILECCDMNIMPLDTLDSSPQAISSDSGGDDFHRWCLFTVEVRNAYGLPFEVTFTRSQDGAEYVADPSVVPPGCTSRIVLPIRRFRLPEDSVLRPLAPLGDRKTVAARSTSTAKDQLRERELFWYREELLKIVHARWKEANGSRFGELSLRRQRITSQMLNVLKTDLVHVELKLAGYEAKDGLSTPLERTGGKFMVPPNTIVNLQVLVTNTGPSPLIMTVDLSPIPEEHVLFEGVLTNIPLGTVAGGESKLIEVPFCFLCAGQFEVGAEAQTLEKGRAGVGWLRALVAKQFE